jgi:hypothetical protein
MAFLSEDDWRDLVHEIHNRRVIPIVGPELVTVSDPATGARLTVEQFLAPLFAQALGTETRRSTGASQPEATQGPVTLNGIASAYLLSGGKPKRIYSELSGLLDQITAPPPPALLDLASITDFDLFIAGTIDPLLALALAQTRPAFRPAEHVRAYDHKRPVDIPEHLGPGFVYHLLGSRQTYPNFAVWEEDFLEFICGLVRHHAQLERLFLLLKTRYLLILGAPFSDWVMRFFLFVAKGGRFTERRRDDVTTFLADQERNLGEPLMFFFDQVVGTMRIIRGDPAAFVAELASRWRAQHAAVAAPEGDPLAQMAEEMPRGAVFISYSHDDIEATRVLVRQLLAAQIPVWVDKQRLHGGQNYERSLEHAVKNGCSFFLSLISRATEGDPTRYVHKERRWAAQRHVDGFGFYLPAIIDDTPIAKQEPPEFAKIHHERMPGGQASPEFVRHLLRWVEEWRLSGQPRS